MKNILNAIEIELKKRNLNENDISTYLKDISEITNRRIIGGYASVDIIDREKQRIPIEALADTAKRFMDNPFFRLVNVFHSDVSIGRVLPKWTHPLTGEIYTTHVDKTGWWVVCEIRDDVEIANKVWDEIKKGNLRSFSIAGSSRDKAQNQSNGTTYEQVNDLDTVEVSVCFPGETKVWTKRGLLPIKDVQIGDYVLTHKTNKTKPAWKKVLKTMSRDISENLVKITTEHGILTPTSNHPIRILNYGGSITGSKYIWKNASDLKLGDSISFHIPCGVCAVCKTPLFSHQEKFCSVECKNKLPNRKGKTIASGDIGQINQAKKIKGHPGYNYGMSEEGRKKQIASLKTESFRQKCRNRMGEVVRKYLRSHKPNKAELKLEKILNDVFPNEWKFVGNGEVFLGTKNPDFININVQKKIIELNGEYWHQKDIKGTRETYFKRYGYETLIITDKELNDINYVKEKLNEFCGNTLSKIISITPLPFTGLVYNLEVEDDNSYTTEFAVVHNCEIPVNSMSHFDILWDPNAINIFGY